MVQVFGLEKCSTCDKAREWLKDHKVDFEFTDYRDNPIAPAKLKVWAKQLGWEKLVNRASYTWRDLPADKKEPPSEVEWLALVKEFPALIKRPVVVQGDTVNVGFAAKKFGEMFKQK